MAEKQTIAQAVAMLAEAYNQKPTKATFLLFESALDGVSDAALKQAVANQIRSADTWMPKPGRLRAYAMRIEQEPQRRARLAWDEAVKFGRTDPLSSQLMPQLGVGPSDGEAFYVAGRKRFLLTYANAMRTSNCNLLAAANAQPKLLEAPPAIPKS